MHNTKLVLLVFFMLAVFPPLVGWLSQEGAVQLIAGVVALIVTTWVCCYWFLLLWQWAFKPRLDARKRAQ